MMVNMGDADGLVAGSICSTADTLRPALQILKTAQKNLEGEEEKTTVLTEEYLSDP